MAGSVQLFQAREVIKRFPAMKPTHSRGEIYLTHDVSWYFKKYIFGTHKKSLVFEGSRGARKTKYIQPEGSRVKNFRMCNFLQLVSFRS